MYEYENQVILNQGRVVKRGETELQFFSDEKNACAWILHTFGLTYFNEAKDLGLTLESFRNRGPKYGDIVTYSGKDEFYTDDKGKGRTGILEGIYGAGKFGICFGASAYREGNSVSCSGGPIPHINPATLVFAGLKDVPYWRWHKGYSGGGQGGTYYMTVPHWVWGGVEAKASPHQ
jgi:hypothetical protein